MRHFFCHHRTKNFIALTLINLLWSWEIFAQASSSPSALSPNVFNDSFNLLFLLIGISILPFLAVMSTSFTKIVVVLSFVRLALGTSQTPPNIVIMSLAIILTTFSMYPVGQRVYEAFDHSQLNSAQPGATLANFLSAASDPMREFLSTYAKAEDRAIFLKVMNNRTREQKVSDDDFIILAPAFLISELTSAFQIGFLIYLPFLVIDMTVANLLMALGMQMLAPTTISLPFKILLFVLVDGWRLISEGLVKGAH